MYPIFLAVLCTADGGVAADPFILIHRSVHASFNADVYSHGVFHQMRDRQPVGLAKLLSPGVNWTEVPYADLEPKAKQDPANHEFAKVWGLREGVLLYSDVSGRERRLPPSLPFLGKSAHVSLPHRAVWYRVLREDESLDDWLTAYAAQYTQWHVIGRGGACRVLRSKDVPKAVLEITGPPPMLLDPRAREMLDRQPLSPDDYYISGSRFGDANVRGYVRQVGRVVFRAAFPELFDLDLASLSKRIVRTRAGYVVEFEPLALPREQMAAFARLVRRVAAPSLQRRDAESESDYSRRTVLSKWQLDLITLALEDVEAVRFELNGIGADEGPLAFSLSVNTKGAGIHRLLGNPRVSPRSSLLDLRGKPAAATAVYHGQLPAALVSSLEKLAAAEENPAIARILRKMATERMREILLKIGSLDKEEGPAPHVALYGAATSEYASELVAAIGPRGHTGALPVQFHPQAGRNVPSQIGIVASGGVLYFAMGNADTTEWLNQVRTSSVSRRSDSTFIDLDIDLAKLATSPRSAGFDALPARFLDEVEQLAGRIGLTLALGSNFSLASQDKALRNMEKSPDLAEAAERSYFESTNQYLQLKKNKLDPRKDSFRHWLAPGTSTLKLNVTIKKNTLTISGSAGRSIYRMWLAQLQRARLTVLRTQGL